MFDPLNSAEHDLSAADYAALQGSWEQAHMEADGIVNPPDNLTEQGRSQRLPATTSRFIPVAGPCFLKARLRWTRLRNRSQLHGSTRLGQTQESNFPRVMSSMETVSPSLQLMKVLLGRRFSARGTA
jgi:hypothetical protein